MRTAPGPQSLNVTVRALSGEESKASIGALSDILVDCVEGGASVSFMAPLAREKASTFWQQVAHGVGAGERALLVAEDTATGEFLGTVQLVLADHVLQRRREPGEQEPVDRQAEQDQPERADLSKMLVRRTARKRGIGAALMRAVEDAARAAGKTLLVLDTASPEAERLYGRAGWIRVGAVPGFALLPDGRPCHTVFFYKNLA